MSTITAEPPKSSVSVRMLAPAEINDSDLQHWRDLEHVALEPNPYLSCDFVLPAVEHMGGITPTIIAVENATGMIGLGVFRERSATARFPLRSLGAFRTPHSYLTGVLLHRDHANAAARALVASLLRGDWPAVGFSDLRWDAPATQVLRAAFADSDAVWYEESARDRALLRVDTRSRQTPAEYIEKSIMKRYRRARTKLAQLGDVSWRCLTGADVTGEVIDRFIRLEHSGWKGIEGTSLRANPQHEKFFRAMMQRFSARGDAFFTELSSGGRVIASTSNLLSCGEGFAFKVGWDVEFKDVSPGLLNELFFLDALDTLHFQLRDVDSGSAEGSFIEALWPDRSRLASGFFIFTARGRMLARVLSTARQLKRRIGAA